jgi:hypothetical protein
MILITVHGLMACWAETAACLQCSSFVQRTYFLFLDIDLDGWSDTTSNPVECCPTTPLLAVYTVFVPVRRCVGHHFDGPTARTTERRPWLGRRLKHLASFIQSRWTRWRRPHTSASTSHFDLTRPRPEHRVLLVYPSTVVLLLCIPQVYEKTSWPRYLHGSPC